MLRGGRKKSSKSSRNPSSFLNFFLPARLTVSPGADVQKPSSSGDLELVFFLPTVCLICLMEETAGELPKKLSFSSPSASSPPFAHNINPDFGWPTRRNGKPLFPGFLGGKVQCIRASSHESRTFRRTTVLSTAKLTSGLRNRGRGSGASVYSTQTHVDPKNTYT
jgi:hypothetical protein